MSREDILRHLDEHGVDFSLCGDNSNEKKRPNRKKKVPKTETIDLHGMTKTEAKKTLLEKLQKSSAAKTQKLRIIHGKGRHSDPETGPVIKKMVENFLETEMGRSIKDYRPAPGQIGESGVTIVTLNKH